MRIQMIIVGTAEILQKCIDVLHTEWETVHITTQYNTDPNCHFLQLDIPLLNNFDEVLKKILLRVEGVAIGIAEILEDKQQYSFEK